MKIYFRMMILLLVVTFSHSYAADDLLKYIPQTGEVKMWERMGNPLLFSSEELFKLINGAAEVYYEYGFEKALNQEYIKDDTLSIIVNIFKMKNPEAGYGIFCFGRQKDYEITGIGEFANESEYSISFCKGSFYVEVESFMDNDEIRSARKVFANYIASKIKEGGGIPDIFKSLPEANSVSGSEKFINGIISLNNIFFISDDNILDIGNSGVGAYREYGISGRNVKLILIEYKKNPDEIFHNTANFFNKSDNYINFSKKQDINIWQKKRGGYVLLKKINNHIICAFNIQNKDDGINIISNF